MTDLEQQIAEAHQAAEESEQRAAQIEARMRSAGINPPARRYGQPVNIVGNLTITAQLQEHDPGLAAFLGVPGDLARREAEAAAARELQAERMWMLTEQSRQANQAAADARFRRQIAPVYPPAGGCDERHRTGAPHRGMAPADRQ